MGKIRTDIINRKTEILSWVKTNESKSTMCRRLHCKPITLDAYLKKFGIEYRGNKGLKGKSADWRKVSAKEYATRTNVKSHLLKLKLLDEGIKRYQCELCGITEWQGKSAPLELDHIDGNHFNNDFANLRILCPNCHSQQETSNGKNLRK